MILLVYGIVTSYSPLYSSCWPRRKVWVIVGVKLNGTFSDSIYSHYIQTYPLQTLPSSKEIHRNFLVASSRLLTHIVSAAVELVELS